MGSEMEEFNELLKMLCESAHKAEGGNLSDVYVGFEQNGRNWTAKTMHTKGCISHGVGDSPIEALRSLKKATACWYGTVVRESRVNSLERVNEAIARLTAME